MTQKPDGEDFPRKLNGSYPNGHYRGEYFGESTLQRESLGDDAEEIDIRQLISLLLYNKWLIAGVTGLCTVLAVLIALSIMPIYESEGTLIISAAPNRYSMAGSDISSLLMSSYGIGIGSSVDNEIEILNSRSLVNDLANRIYEERFDQTGRLYPVLWRAYPKDSTLTTIDTVAIRIAEGKFIGQKGGKMSSILSIKYQSPSPLEAARMVDLIIGAYSEVSTRSNREQAKAALRFLSTELENVKEAVEEREEQLRGFMNRERLVQLDAQTEELIRTLSRLESEKQVIDVKLVGATKALEQYTAELELFRPGLTSNLSSGTYGVMMRLQVQMAEFETEKLLLEAKNPKLRENPRMEPRFVQLDSQIEFLRAEIKRKTEQLIQENGGEHVLGFVGSLDGGAPKKLMEIRENQLRVLLEQSQYQAQSKVLQSQIDQYSSFFNNLPDNMIELARMKRDLQINEQLYLTLAKQNAEMALWEQTQSGLARVVDYSFIPDRPVKPKKRVVVMIGFVLGGAISVGFVFMKNFLKKEIDSVEKLRAKKYAVLSIIPNLEPYIKEHFDGAQSVRVKGAEVSTGLVTLLDSISPHAESYRRLQSNISYSKPDDPYKVIMVTSSNKSEGKTTLASNLAVTMAETGNKVLIVDCDFRRPRLHHVFGVASTPGLVELLFTNEDPAKYIKPSVIPNVSVLTAGNRPPNPGEINRSKKLSGLIAKLRYEFDYVIIDTPPYGIITDAAPLIKLADGLVVVCKFNQTKNMELDHTLENLQRVNANIIGTAMTAFDASKTTGYYYTDYYYQYSMESYYQYDKRGA